jgi:HlyD family secretion protein
VTRRIVVPAVIVLAIAIGTVITTAVPALPARTSSVPTARVTKGPLKLTVYATGELRAGRTVTLVAPPVGGMLRIVKLVPTGLPVKAGETVVEFDPADQQYALEQAKSELAEAEQQIVKTNADAAVQRAQDEVALLTARFDVRRAELDALGNEFVGTIEARKNVLSLEEARRRLAQLEEDVKSRAATNEASLAVSLEKRTKAQLSMQRAQQTIDSLVIRAPLDGVVSLKENRDAAGGMFFWGMILPEIRAGDQVWPGRPVAEVIESGRMEMRAKIDESDRGNLVTGQPGTLRVDGLPVDTFMVHVGELAGLASRANFFDSTTATRQFDISFQFDRPDPRLRAGVSARVTIEGKEIPDALHVPRQAVFDKKGKTFVYMKTGERFQEHEVKVEQRTESRVAITGVPEGTEIALVDPNSRSTGAARSSGPAAPAAGAPR